MTIDAFGMWPLPRLGASTLSLDVAAAQPSAVVKFAFAPHARQGPSGWYIGHLRATVALAPSPLGGVAYLNASVGNWNWAQIRIHLERRRGGLFVHWSCPSLVDDHTSGDEAGTVAHIRYANFLPRPSVHPGPTTLAFTLLRFHGATATRAIVGASSGLEYTRIGPARLRATLSARRSVVRVGARIVLTSVITNSGQRAVHKLTLLLDNPDLRLRRLRGPQRPSRALRPGEHRRVKFVFRARRPGSAQLYLTAIGDIAATQASYRLRIVP